MVAEVVAEPVAVEYDEVFVLLVEVFVLVVDEVPDDEVLE